MSFYKPHYRTFDVEIDLPIGYLYKKILSVEKSAAIEGDKATIIIKSGLFRYNGRGKIELAIEPSPLKGKTRIIVGVFPSSNKHLDYLLAGTFILFSLIVLLMWPSLNNLLIILLGLTSFAGIFYLSYCLNIGKLENHAFALIDQLKRTKMSPTN